MYLGWVICERGYVVWFLAVQAFRNFDTNHELTLYGSFVFILAIINHGAYRWLHPLLIVQRAVGPTELAVPSHQISAGGVIDADLLARLTDAYAFLRNHLDESLPLIIGWLAVLKADFARVDVLLQGCALL